MKLAPIIARLKIEVPSLGGRVAGAADLAALLDGKRTLALPHAFVIPGGESVPESNTAGAVMQEVTEQVAVVVAIETSDGRGQEGAETLDDIRTELWEALLGFVPAPQHAGLQYAGSEHIDFDRAVLVHQYVFETTHTIQQL